MLQQRTTHKKHGEEEAATSDPEVSPDATILLDNLRRDQNNALAGERWNESSQLQQAIVTLLEATSGPNVTKGSVSYLSSPCFSTSLGGIGGPARAIHRILAVMYWISIIRGGGAPPPPENGHGFNSHG